MDDPLKIMFLGTGSDVGKSICATAFCRILLQRGYRVSPFKAQNMSNNSYVTLEGGEIGRAQAVQAEAAGRVPSVLMNPVLLKPAAGGCQVVLHGQVLGNMVSNDYYAARPRLLERIMASFHELEQDSDAMVIEGAGSCSEVNLRHNDIVNFEIALRVNAPVILVADIDRGGVFAQIVGTLELISEQERNQIAGFLINKFRGDKALFQEGVEFLERRTGKPVFGVVPAFSHIRIDMEDSMSLENAARNKRPQPEYINIAAVQLPLVSNFTDLEALEREPLVNVCWLNHPENLDQYDAVIIPGSKSTLHDAQWMHETGWGRALASYVAQGRGLVVGLCGGFQILGRDIRDPGARDGNLVAAAGLGLLDVSTEIQKSKVVRLSQGTDEIYNVDVRGYEIHMGATNIGPDAKPFLSLETGPDGAVNQTGTIFGTYLHGLFDSGAFRCAFLSRLARNRGIQYDAAQCEDHWAIKDSQYNFLADHFKKNLDIGKILEIIQTF